MEGNNVDERGSLSICRHGDVQEEVTIVRGVMKETIKGNIFGSELTTRLKSTYNNIAMREREREREGSSFSLLHVWTVRYVERRSFDDIRMCWVTQIE